MTTNEKIQDFKYLYDVLEKNYPFFKVNERMHGINWLENKNKYKRIIRNTKNDAQFLVAMDRILGDLNNGHVNIFGGDGYRWLYEKYHTSLSQSNALEYLALYDALSNPYTMYRYKFDGNIESFTTNKKPVLETRMLITDQIAYMKIKEMANVDIVKKDTNQINKFLKEIEDYEKLIIDIRGNGGGYDDYWQNIVSLLIDEPLHAKYYIFFKESFKTDYDTYRVKNLNVINKLDEDILDGFPEEVKTDFNFFKACSIRVNPWNIGFDNSNHINFKGKIYLLVDNGVFSSSEKFASFSKDTGFATLVGQPTGGDRVFEEIPLYFLHNSKFVIRYSREMGINMDGTINMETKTVPNIIVNSIPNEDWTKDEFIKAVISDKDN